MSFSHKRYFATLWNQLAHVSENNLPTNSQVHIPKIPSNQNIHSTRNWHLILIGQLKKLNNFKLKCEGFILTDKLSFIKTKTENIVSAV